MSLRPPPESNTTFSGLMSRCTTPCACRCCSADSSGRMTRAADSDSLSLPPAPNMACSRLPPAAISCTMATSRRSWPSPLHAESALELPVAGRALVLAGRPPLVLLRPPCCVGSRPLYSELVALRSSVAELLQAPSSATTSTSVNTASRRMTCGCLYAALCSRTSRASCARPMVHRDAWSYSLSATRAPLSRHLASHTTAVLPSCMRFSASNWLRAHDGRCMAAGNAGLTHNVRPPGTLFGLWRTRSSVSSVFWVFCAEGLGTSLLLPTEVGAR
mmetsp:Transcript_5352/g.13205  ORF Transcript_5352/g.13205 Transcript_5352/m.13205 type:complete len:274 (-) Transcript_5352:197-1018(-)